MPGAQGPWPGLARGLGPGVSKCVAAFAVPRSTVCGKGWGGDALIRAPLRVADVGGGLGDVGGEGEVGGMGGERNGENGRERLWPGAGAIRGPGPRWAEARAWSRCPVPGTRVPGCPGPGARPLKVDRGHLFEFWLFCFLFGVCLARV